MFWIGLPASKMRYSKLVAYSIIYSFQITNLGYPMTDQILFVADIRVSHFVLFDGYNNVLIFSIMILSCDL